MSEQNPTEFINKKRGRDRQKKISANKTISKLIQKKLKRGKKPKINSHKINIIKPKPIKKKLINYQNFETANTNLNNQTEKEYTDEEKDLKKDETCHENSLGQLTKNFINYIKKTGNKSININDLVNELSVKKRRIYDITNVLQGIGYLQKSGKNEIVWTKSIENKNKSKKKLISQNRGNSKNNKQKTNIKKLEQEKAKLDEDIKEFKNEFNSLAKKSDFQKYGYVTMDDFKELSINNKVNLFIIKANKGTVLNILDKNDIKVAYNNVKNSMENGEMKPNELLLNILKKNNQLSFNCPENSQLNLYNIKDGEIQELGNNENNYIINNENNIPIAKFVNNNFNINNLIENKNYNVAVNYNININKDSLVQNNNINNKNNYALLNNKEEIVPNNFINKNYLVKNNERESNDIFYSKVTINNDQKNIGVYFSPSKPHLGQYKFNNPTFRGNLDHYQNTTKKISNSNIKRSDSNPVDERYQFKDS